MNEEARKSCLDNDLFFKKLIDLVPPQFYFDSESKQKIANARSLGLLSSESDLNSKSKPVPANKYDPDFISKTSDLQKALPKLPERTPEETDTESGIESEDETDLTELPSKKSKSSTINNKISPQDTNNVHNSAVTKKSIPETSMNGDVELIHSGIHSEDSPDSDAEQSTKMDTLAKVKEKGQKMSKKDKKAKATKLTAAPKDPVSSQLFPSGSKPTGDELRDRLKARIDELRAKRIQDMTPEEFLEKKKLRRKDSKLKAKQKRKEAKKLRQSAAKQQKNTESKVNGVSEVSPDDAKKNANKMVFSKFEFSNQQKKTKKDREKKPKSYRELYEKVTKEKEQFEELKNTDAEKAAAVAEKKAWRKAMDQSKGIKVKDNPELIKKTMKKEEKLKQKSAKKWQERKEQVEDLKKQKQDKRKKNIQAKKQANKTKKLDKARKKGRLIGGF